MNFFGAQFSADTARGRVEGNRWILSGKLFEAGSYADKQFEMSESELAAAAARFKSPVPVKDEHQLSWFNNKLGEVIRVEAKGKELVGDVAFPIWMKDAAGTEPIGLSCEFERDTKNLAAVAMTISPRVEDAVLFSAFKQEIGAGTPEVGVADEPAMRALFTLARATFAKKRTYEGQSVLQSIHDTAARSGAVCTIKDNGNTSTTNFHTSAELTRIQEVHDVAVKGGAKCSSGDGRPSYYFSNTSATSDTQREKTMPEESKPSENAILAYLKELFGGKSDAPASGAAATAAAAAAAAPAAGAAAFNNDPKILERLKASEAARFGEVASRLVREGRIASKMKDTVIADFNRALEDDLTAPRVVKFSVTEQKVENGQATTATVEKEGTRVDERIAFYSAMPKSTSVLMEEHIAPDQNARVLLSDETPDSIFADVDKQAEGIAAQYKPYTPEGRGNN